MAYKKFALYLKWIDQIVYEIIANLFTHSFLSASLLILIPLILFGKIVKRTAHTNSNHYNLFHINYKNMFVKKELSVYQIFFFFKFLAMRYFDTIIESLLGYLLKD